MSNKKTELKLLNWVFLILSAGMLIAAGIFIEKIALTDASILDYISVAGFAIAGIAIAAYKFLVSSE